MLILYSAIADLARCRIENFSFFAIFYRFSGVKIGFTYKKS